MFCTRCGSELKEGARFCARCGAPAPAPAANPAAQTPGQADGAARQAADPAGAPPQQAVPAPGAPPQQAAPVPPAPPEQTPPVPPAPAEPSPAPAPAGPAPKAGRGVVVGIVVAVAVLLALVIGAVAFLGGSPASVAYGQSDPVPVSSTTRIRPQDASGTPLTTYSVALIQPDADDEALASVETTPHRIDVDGDGGFQIADFGDVEPGAWRVAIIDGDGGQRDFPADYEPDNPDADDEIVVGPPAGDADEKPGAYELYWQKCREYLDAYGDPQVITSDTGDCMACGLCVARLIDFDGDGTEELLLAYNRNGDFESKDIAGYLDRQLEGFVVEVWAYRPDEGSIELVYDEPGSLETTNGGYFFLQTFTHDGEPALRSIARDESEYRQDDAEESLTVRYLAYDGTDFSPETTVDHVFSQNGARSYLNGAEASADETNAAIAGYEVDLNVPLYGFASDQQTYEATVAGLDETQRVLDELEAAVEDGGGDSADDGAAASYTVAQQEETSVLASSQGPGTEFTVNARWSHPVIEAEGGETPAGVEVLNERFAQEVADSRAAAEAWTYDSGEQQDHGRVIEVTSIADGIVATRTDTYGFYGGAHGTRFMSGAFFDLETGEQLSIADALGYTPDDLRVMADEGIRAFLAANPSDILTDGELSASIEDIAGTEGNFFLTDEGLAVYALEGSLGSTAFGGHAILVQSTGDLPVGSELTYDTSYSF